MDESDGVWILDSGSSRHLVNDATWLDEVEDCEAECLQPNGDPLIITKKGSVTLCVTACGVPQTVKLTEVYYAAGVVHNLISYDQLDLKGCTLGRKNGRRVVADRSSGRVVFDVMLRRNVLVVAGTVERRRELLSQVIMAALDHKGAETTDSGGDV